jgi:hypothetical protein
MGVRDPGYGSTSKMIAESALCLVRDVRRHVCFLGRPDAEQAGHDFQF